MPNRAFALPIAISWEPTVRDLLAASGLDEAEAHRGFNLFGRRSSHASDVDVNGAIAELKQWDERRDPLIAFGLAERRSPTRRAPDDLDDVEDPTLFIDPNKPTS